MFSKPTFGQANPPAFGGFSTPGTSNTAGTSAPFGQNSFNKPATSTTGFPAPSFGGGGSTMFGGGTTTTGAGMFGSTAAPAFGQPAQQNQPGFSGFNTGSSAPMFGASSGVSSFAQPKPTFGGFGTNTSSSGLFGAQPTVSGTTAGQPGNSLFNQGPNLFGSAQPQNATTQFQGFQPSLPSFGTPGATGGTATLGTPIKFNPPTGTDSMAKNGITSTINTRHQCITCMKEYENKSLEELRLEDLQAGRKGPTGGDGLFGGAGTNQPGQQSLFGAPSLAQPGTSATGFGDNKSLFGQPATTNAGLGGFGNTAPAFGATQTSGGLFGKPTGFGTTTNTTASGFSFNNNNNNNAAAANPFGAANQAKPFGAAPTTSMFGTQQNTGNMFGAQNATGFGGFGTQQNQQQQGIGLFGQNKTAAPFGLGTPQQQQQPAVSTGFGFAQNTVNNTQAGGLFGPKPALGTGLATPAFGGNNMFGAKPAGTAAPVFGTSSFGATTNTGLAGTTNLFGQQQFNKPAGAGQPFGFGQQQGGANTALGGTTGLGTQGGLFNSLGKPAASVGMFGTSGGSLFGTNTITAQNTGFNLGSGLNFNSTSGNTGGLNLGQSNSLGFGNKPMFSGLTNTMGMQSIGPTEDPHKRMLALCSYPYGDKALFRNLPSDFSKLEEMRLKTTSPAMQKVAVNQSPAFNISTGKPKLLVSPLTSTPAKKSMFEGLDTTPSIIGSTESITPSFSVRRLNLRTKLTKPPAQAETIETPERNDTTEFSPRSPIIASWLISLPDSSSSSNREGGCVTETPKTTKDRETEAETTVSEVVPPRRLAMEDMPTILNDSNASVSLSFSDTSENRSHEEVLDNDVTREPHPAGIILNRTDYYTIPSLADLAKMTDENGRCMVQNFTIGRENYGNIYFEDSFDVSGLNLDALVHIRHKEVVVHPDDELKPPLGEGLNRRAQVTLDRVYPINKQTRTPITDTSALTEMNYEDHLRQTCGRMKVRFLEYRPDTGSWVFKVDHFSKYGVDEDDAENEENLAPVGAKKLRPEAAKAAPQKVPLKQQPLQPVQKPAPATPHHTMLDTETMDEGFPEAQSPTDQLSKIAGTDTSKMRLMKASLFTMDEDMEVKDCEVVEERRIEPLQDSLIEPMYDTPPPSVGYSVMYDAEAGTQEEEEMEETVQKRPHQQPKLVTPKLQTLPLRTPLAFGKCIPDAGLFMTRQFTPSWGPGARLMICDGFSLSQFSPYQHTPSFTDWVECHLNVQLNHTTVHEDSGLVPRRGARHGLGALEDHCDNLELRVDQDQREKIIRQVFHLCLALWGDLKALSEDSPATLVAHERRRAVSEWLHEVMSEENNSEQHSGITHVAKNLTRGQLLDSVISSQQMGDHYSAMVLATAGSATYPRQLVQRQLQEWVGDSIGSLVNVERLRCWLLAGAGLPVLSMEDGDTLNALQGLDWIYCLAAHFWYLSSSAASIPDVLTRYEEAFTGPHSYAAAPVPPGGSEENLDVRFHLLKLFSQRTHPLEQLLCVETHFPETPLDFSLGWLLLQLLDALNYTHVSEHCSQGLHLAFAEQLEAAGLWQWAVFVLQHISQPDMRSSAVEKVIGRHVTLDQTCWSSPDDLHPMEDFVVSKLGVPAKMVFEAKAYLAACRQKHAETACYQLYAGNFSECHTTLVKHLAADAIINEESRLLLRLLRALRPHGADIDGWESSGQVFLNYLSLMEDLRGLQPVGIAESSSVRTMGNLEAVHQRVTALISQLSNLPSDSPKNRLCQSEIARRTIAVARSLLSPSDDMAAALQMTDAIINLPLPDDYRLQELRHATQLIIQDLH